MIAAWMLYSTFMALALGLAALAAERALGLYRRPARFVWLSAMLGALILPPVAELSWRGGHAVSLGYVVSLPTIQVIPDGPLGWLRAQSGTLDGALMGVWVAGSVLLLLSLAASLLRLRRERAHWSRSAVEGCPVLVSPDLGPALVGLSSLAIVIPRWFLDLPGETRRLALLHEREHLEAGDTRLLALGFALAALMPWNAAIWWQLRRLRAAAELDCDRRVLRTGVSAHAYADALLNVGARGRAWESFQPALAEPKSLLSRRIGAMFTKPQKTAWLRAAGYGLAGTLLLVLACETPAPERTAGTSAAQAATNQGGVAAVSVGDVVAAKGLLPEPVSLQRPEYPAMLREAGIEGRVDARFVVGTDGRVEPGSIEIVSSTNKAFEAPTRYAIQNSVFRPGRVNGKPVKVRVQMPVAFVLPK